MKKLFHLLFVIFFLMSCDSEISLESSEENDMVEVSFEFQSDDISIKDNLLTRAFASSAKTYYAVQIDSYYETIYEKIGYVEGCSPYAHGLFTEPEKMRISLPKNTKYKFSACILKEREDTLYHVGEAYGMPFCNGYLYSNAATNGRNALLKNDFVINSTFSMEFSEYYNQTSENAGSPLQRCDKYIGEIEMEVSDASKITIPMKRYTFGILYNIVPPIDGKLSVCIPGIQGADTKIDKEIYSVSAGEQQKEEQVIYNIKESKKLDLIIRWDRDDKEKEFYRIEKSIILENNKNYRLDINLNNRDGESSFEMLCDNEFDSMDIITVK